MADLYDGIHISGAWCNDSTGGLDIICDGDHPRRGDEIIQHDGYEAGLDDCLTLSRIIELAEEHRKQFHETDLTSSH